MLILRPSIVQSSNILLHTCRLADQSKSNQPIFSPALILLRQFRFPLNDYSLPMSENAVQVRFTARCRTSSRAS
jgi:hypothetical protein